MSGGVLPTALELLTTLGRKAGELGLETAWEQLRHAALDEHPTLVTGGVPASAATEIAAEDAEVIARRFGLRHPQ